MKKIIAVAVVALMMFAFAASSFALVVDAPAAYKNPPVFIDGLTVSDAWMSGLTVQNWKASLTNQAYAEGSYIWFIAKIGVSGNGDTDAQHLWDGRAGQTATLTMTGKDNCLNFSSANMATLSRISGMSVDARSIRNNDLAIVEAVENKAVFTFTNRQPDWMDTNRVLVFGSRLEVLELDAIYGADTWNQPINWNINNAPNYGAPVANVSVGNRATIQKDFYLHFMAITKASTEGVCVGTMKVNGEDTFKREVQLYDNASYSSYVWYASNTNSTSDTQLLPGDRSNLYLLYNTVNGKQYSIMKISNEAVAQASGSVASRVGPFGGSGVMYVLMNKEATEVVCGFVVDKGFVGLTVWNKDNKRAKFGLDRPGGKDPATGITDVGKASAGYATGNDAYYYDPAVSNDFSNNVVQLFNPALGGTAMTTSELQAIFDFFGFAYVNPKAPGDGDFLARSGLVTVAEAKYNVANAVITTPDTNIVIPKTGDAATSTGLILVASAILAAAAVGFVLSKRAHN